MKLFYGTKVHLIQLSSLSSVPPKFIKPLSDIDICRDEDAGLQCQFIGFPEPELVWYKDEVEYDVNTLDDSAFYRVKLPLVHCLLIGYFRIG